MSLPTLHWMWIKITCSDHITGKLKKKTTFSVLQTYLLSCAVQNGLLEACFKTLESNRFFVEKTDIPDIIGKSFYT